MREEEDYHLNSLVEDDYSLMGNNQRFAEMTMVVRDMESMDCIHSEREKVGDDPMPLCTLLPGVSMVGCFSKWVLKKVQESQEFLGFD